MTAQDYPITFPYGATDGQYYGPNGSIGPYHRGDDRAMPNGTPVIVNGVQIGLSNNTGASSGSHLHIGKFVNGTDVNPNGGGFNLKSPVKVITVSSDSTNGNYVRLQDGDGAYWVYLHLQSQSVSVGQELKGGTTMSPDALNLLAQVAWNKSVNGDDPFVKGYAGKAPETVLTDVLRSDANKELRTKAANFDGVQSALQSAYKEIDALQGQVDGAAAKKLTQLQTDIKTALDKSQ